LKRRNTETQQNPTCTPTQTCCTPTHLGVKHENFPQDAESVTSRVLVCLRTVLPPQDSQLVPRFQYRITNWRSAFFSHRAVWIDWLRYYKNWTLAQHGKCIWNVL